ncbi:hypothetical protein CAPTEDRAFT_193426 [Capitella teleta]|uniref:Uncharacterized protein n=1 Tax=Capitella teleta TaxID=283909 RepID=R7U1E0_CAPTE|nr:hypothetical protein CAPTEDRAFT_193426 [Capitella teleta]|eukprot:ELT97466.1 hypothetical protein CAPTEDRAFT_193426 [Capitella teleta]
MDVVDASDVFEHLQNSSSLSAERLRAFCPVKSADDVLKAREESTKFLDWAKSEPNLKVTSADIPYGILPDQLQGSLHDVRVFTKRGPDDTIYDNNPEIREKVPRGACFLEITSGPRRGVFCIIYALKKFTGGLGDDDDCQGNAQAWLHYFSKPMSEASRVLCMNKANGEAAHLAAFCINDKLIICAGSKNVHMAFTGRDDLDKYGANVRYSVAKEVAETVLDHLEEMEVEKKER